MDLINLGQEGEMYSCVDSTNLIIFKDTKKIICNFFRKLSWFFCWFDGGKKNLDATLYLVNPAFLQGFMSPICHDIQGQGDGLLNIQVAPITSPLPVSVFS